MNNWQALKKVIKPRNIIIVIILLVANTFAWFLYATEVENQMSAHVKAWQVVFQSGDSPIDDFVTINVESMFPGMREEIHEIHAFNQSEVEAYMTYTLLEANILGDRYATVEGKKLKGETVLPTDYTSEELLEKLERDYPFIIKVSLNKTELDANYDEAIFQIKITWLYESGNDTADTYWGSRAATFIENYPDSSCILLNLKISIVQAV